MNEIEVVFQEQGKSSPFARTLLPPDRLPDTFEINTTMHLGEEDWIVVEADPQSKEDFSQTGKLKLTMIKSSEIKMMDPSEILFTLPTIENTTPPMVDSDSLENVAVFHEDDWRQYEMVSTASNNKIEQEFEGILRVHQECTNGAGFSELHLRELIENPLEECSLQLSDLKSYFGVSHEYTGVAFNVTAAVIVNGFAFEDSDGWLFWGFEDENGIAVLNLSPSENGCTAEYADKMDRFLEKYQLHFVNWSAVSAVGCNRGSFIQLFEK